MSHSSVNESVLLSYDNEINDMNYTVFNMVQFSFLIL
jgi:hypothetical protein